MRFAEEGDGPALAALINRAFQVERFFLDKDRLTLAEVEARLRSGRFLVAEEAGRLVGCLYLEERGERTYFGLISVTPQRQGAGLGKRLIAEAEEHCRARGCRFVDLNIVSLRTELPPFYRKLGYAETGTAPFPENEPVKMPCHFIQMSKTL
jgi:GNAT superfamily N-acetyltransferase